MSRVYIAHNFAAREEMIKIAVDLTARGHKVTSRWIYHGLVWGEEEGAVACLEDLEKSDDLLLFAQNYGRVPGRGKYIEFGFSLRAGKRCIVICPNEADSCVFFHLPNVRVVDTYDEALPLLSGGSYPR